jgi:hypothetical protein
MCSLERAALTLHRSKGFTSHTLYYFHSLYPPVGGGVLISSHGDGPEPY